MAEPGAVAWQFERKGEIVVEASSGASEDDVMLAALEAGAEDVVDEGDVIRVTTAPTDLHVVRKAIEEAGIAVASGDLTLVATTTVGLESEGDARRVLRLMDALEDHDDVQAVHANFDIPDSVLQAVSV
jgi:transcriptional/translational regulatory protein YebC/TACO1